MSVETLLSDVIPVVNQKGSRLYDIFVAVVVSSSG